MAKQSMQIWFLVASLGIISIGANCLKFEPNEQEWLLFLAPDINSSPEIHWLAQLISGQSPASGNQLGQDGDQEEARPEQTLALIGDKLTEARALAASGKTTDRQVPAPSSDSDLASFPVSRIQWLIDVLHEFWLLGEPLPATGRAADCSRQSLQHFRLAVELLFGGLAHFGQLIKSASEPADNVKLFKFMSHYGQARLASCLARVERQVSQLDSVYPRGPESARAEWRLDRMLAKWKSVPEDSELVELARHFDLRSGQYDDPRFASALRMSSGDRDTDRILSVGVFGSDLDETCSEIPSKLTNMIDMLQLAKHLLPEASLEHKISNIVEENVRFGKLIEYQRICNQLVNEMTRLETRDNMLRNFKSFQANE